MNDLEKQSVNDNIQSILEAVENYRQQNGTTSGVIFTDNWYDSHPRLLIFDPILNAYDKLVWLTIRTFCSPDLSLTAFPSYDQIQSSLNISRGTVSCSITKLRVTRWITLLCRNRTRNSAGRFIRDGNVYMVHGEPLDLKSTIELDGDYMNYLNKCCKHRRAAVRKISTLILDSIQSEIARGSDVLINRHPFQRRVDAWASIQGDQSAKFLEHSVQHSRTNSNPPKKVPDLTEVNPSRTEVNQVNYGCQGTQTEVHSESYGVVHHCSNSSSSDKKNNYNTETKENLEEFSKVHVFPKSLSSNQKHLIMLHLQRLPSNLQTAPQPWSTWSQLLLDELAGRIAIGKKGNCSPVWNPVSLMATYCRCLTSNGFGLKEDGQFQIEYAEQVIKSRTKKSNSKKAYQIAQDNYRKDTLNRLKQYQKQKKRSTS